MDGMIKNTVHKETDGEFSFKNYFVPLTTAKAITWIIVIGFIVFANMLFNPPIWDDYEYILNNTPLQAFNIPANFGYNIFNNAGQYRPLTVTYYSLLYTIFGSNLFYYHLIQLSLHITNTVLLFILFKKFFDNKVSFFLSLIFLIHPIQVESVSYVSATDSTIFFLLGIIATLIVIYRKFNYKNVLIQNILLLSSLLVKETGILFFPLIICYQYFFKKKNLLISLIAGMVSIIVYFLVRYFIGNVTLIDRPLIPIARLSFQERLMTIPQVLFYFIKTYFYPVTLGINQQWVVTTATFSNFYLPLIFDILFFSLLILCGFIIYKKNKKIIFSFIFFTFWFLLGLGMHSQIFPLDMTIADRWAYFGLAGLLGIIGLMIQSFALTFERNKITLVIICIIVILLATRTILRNNDWQNTINLWNQAISVNDNFLSEDQLSLAYTYDGKWTDALKPEVRSVALFPNDNNLYNLGYIYEQMGDLNKAKEAYLQAYHAKSYLPWQHNHYLKMYARLAIISLRTNDQKPAKKVLLAGLMDYPSNPKLWYILTICEYKLRDRKSAINAAQQAMKYSPNDVPMENIYQKLLNNQPISTKL